MHSKEGVIKFQCLWEKRPVEVPEDLILFRNKAFTRKWIGFDEKEKVGYGNISLRDKTKKFFISGSQTGHIETASAEHFSLVTSYDFATNKLECLGETKASSESLTHAALYESATEIQAVLHIHHNTLWEKLKYCVPTTPYHIEYGSREMANAIRNLFYKYNMNKFKIIVMAGHFGGIISYGKSLQEAFDVMETYFRKL